MIPLLFPFISQLLRLPFYGFLSFSSIIHCFPLSSNGHSFPSSCLSSYLSVSLSCSIFSLPRSLSLTRSLFSPYSPSLASHSYSSFSCLLLLAFLPVFFLSLVLTLLFLSFFVSFSYSFLHPSLFTLPHYFISSTPFPHFSSPYSSCSYIIYFFLSFVILPNFAFVVVLFPNPSSYSSTSTIPSSCHASFFLSFPIFTILLLFMLSFYISFFSLCLHFRLTFHLLFPFLLTIILSF